MSTTAFAVQAPARLRLATRGSALALWQAHFVRDQLLLAHPSLTVELVEIVSTGDIVRDRPLAEIGGTGVFTKEVQQAVLDGLADLAVHSLKDLPTLPHPELILAAVPARGPVFDALLSVKYHSLAELPAGAVVATSSLRRKAQLLHLRPDLRLVEIRGNVDTRIRKLQEEGLDAILLAQAGLERLDRQEWMQQLLTPPHFLPAVGQGALGIECRREDQRVWEYLQALDDPITHVAVTAERAFLRTLQGGCQAPVGAYAQLDAGQLHLQGIVLASTGNPVFRGIQEVACSTEASASATACGQQLAERLLEAGAATVLPKRDTVVQVSETRAT